MASVKYLIEQVVNGQDPSKAISEAKVVDVWHIKSILAAVQNQTKSLIRAGANIPKKYNKKLFDKSTAHLAEAIDALDEWITFYDKLARKLAAPGK